MTKSTQAFKTGVTFMKGGNVPTYTLEYLAPARKKKTGDFETIVIPYVELGRSKSCNIEYGNDNPTVSRRHASIERKGNNYYLSQLSQTNPTLVNGKPISNEYQLNNGDEIQLSIEGPKLRFNVTASGTSSMGFTQKISLVTRQAIKPYRTIIYSLVIVLIIIAGAGTYFIYKQDKETDTLITQLKINVQKRHDDSVRFANESKNNEGLIVNLNETNKTYISEMNKLRAEVEKIKVKKVEEDSLLGVDIYQLLKDNIYFLEVTEVFVTMPNGESGYLDLKWTGSAFLCDDGKLVTARHCIQGWRYSSIDDEPSYMTNFAELNGGNISVKFRATSNNDWFEFDYKDVLLDDNNDVVIEQTIVEGKGKKSQEYTYIVKYANDSYSDWAYYQTNKTSKITYDKEMSLGLKAGERLYILGFSLAIGGPSEGEVRPLYSEASVAQSGISGDGVITVSDRNFESGNSGGPVFIKQQNMIKCIGIISTIRFDSQQGLSTIGGIVPIGNIK